MRLLVVGAGILGLATAWAARRVGHAVTVLDRDAIPSPRGASNDHHRAFRVAYGARHGYAALALEALPAWQRLWADLGRTHLHLTGHLLLGAAEDPWIMGSLASLRRLEIACEPLSTAALAARCPLIATERVAGAWLTPLGGALMAQRICGDLAAWLRAAGVELVAGSEAVEIDAAGGRVRTADGGWRGGEAILVAAGAWAGRLLPELGARLRPSRQVVIDVDPPQQLVAAWDTAPVLSHVDSRSGSIFYALPAVGGASAKLGDHNVAGGGDPDEPRTASPTEVARIMALASGTLAAAASYRPRAARACFYTMTGDERFLAVARGRMLVVAACSGHGFKFGARLGELTAEVLDGRMAVSEYAARIAAAS